MLYDPRQVHQPEVSLFDTARWRAAGTLTPADRGRGGAWFIHPTPSGGEWALRHYLRGGFVARWNPDRYLWLGAERTRPFRELRLTAALLAAGLPVPSPVAARYVRAGLHYRADLLTVRIPGVQPLSAQLIHWSSAVWDAVGRCVRQFHDAGAWHADLNAHNVLVSEGAGSPAVYLIDWDRGCLLSPAMAARAARGNVLRLQRSLHKLALEAGWLAAAQADAWATFQSAYAAPRGR